MYSLAEVVIYSIASTILSIACVGGNLLVLIAFCVDRGVRVSNNWFIISLAVTDFGIGVLSINLLTMYLLLGYWPLGNFICDTWLALDFTFCLVSQVTVFLITLDRFMSVRHAIRYRNWRSDRKLKGMLTLSWVFPSVLFIPLIYGWYLFTGETRPPSTVCNVPFTHHTLFNTLLTVAYFWIPLVFMISLYVGIYQVAAGLQRKSVTAEKGLADLMMMAGNTMSKIGLAVKVINSTPDQPIEKNNTVPRMTPVKDIQKADDSGFVIDTQDGQSDEKTADFNEHSTEINNFDTNAKDGIDENDSKVDRKALPRRQRRLSDTAALSDNNQGVAHAASQSSFQVDKLDFSANYRSIRSPTAHSSNNSSLYSSEASDPWAHQQAPGDEENQKPSTLPEVRRASEDNSRHEVPTKAPMTAPRSDSFKQAGTELSTQTESSSSKSESKSNNKSEKHELQLKPSIHDNLFRLQTQKTNEQRKVENKKRKRARKALRMISFILGAFVACWTPYHVVVIVKGFCDNPTTEYTCVNDHLYNFAYYMCYMNSPINPFCYALANITFKKAFIRIMKGDLRLK